MRLSDNKTSDITGKRPLPADPEAHPPSKEGDLARVWSFDHLAIHVDQSQDLAQNPIKLAPRSQPPRGKQGFPRSPSAAYDVYLPNYPPDRIYQTLCLSFLSSVIAYLSELRGAIFLHGALASYKEKGVILAGQSGVGKSTTSRRLPPPWVSMCDDLTLVLPAEGGGYQAHPWPSWGSLYYGPQDRSWDVSRSVDLHGIFYLQPFIELRVQPLRRSMAVGRLLDSSHQATFTWNDYLSKDQLRHLRLKRFDAISGLTAVVPAFNLINREHDPVWKAIEQTFDWT